MEPETRPPNDTLSEAASSAIATAIVSGALKPGARLAIRDLAQRFGYGPTPLREALSGLAGRGLVDFIGQRGFRVPQASRADLADIVATRTVVETGALRLAIVHGDTHWEAAIVAALHRLKTFYGSPYAPTPERIDAFEKVNREFHVSLIKGCGSPRLISAYIDLFEQTRRYRALLLGNTEFQVSSFEVHREMADMCLARDAESACEAIRVHNLLVLAVYDQ